MKIPQGPSLSGDEVRNILESNPFPFLEECAREFGPAFTLDVGSRGSGDKRNNGLWHLVWGREYNNHLGGLNPATALSGAGHTLTVGAVLPEHSIFSQDGHDHSWVEALHKVLGQDNETNLSFFVRSIEKHVLLKKENFAKKSTQNAFEFFKSICFAVSFETVFGDHHNSADLTRLGSNQNIEKLKCLLLDTPTSASKVDHSLRHFVKCRELIKDEFKRRKKIASELGPDALQENFFDTLIRLQTIGFNLKDDQIIDNIFINWIKGARTMAAMTNWSMAYLRSYEQRSEETKASCARLISNADWRARPSESLAAESHLNSFIKEMYRLVSLRSIISSRLLTEHTELGEFSLPPGSIVASASHLTHRNPAVYSEPHEFVPSRFIDKPVPRGDWTPFGVAARQCLFARINIPTLAYTVALIEHHFEISKDSMSLHPEYTSLAFHPNLANKISIRAKEYSGNNELLRAKKNAPELAQNSAESTTHSE